MHPGLDKVQAPKLPTFKDDETVEEILKIEMDEDVECMSKISDSDFLLPKERISSILARLTEQEMVDLYKILVRLPCGILAIHGGARCGKTWIMMTLLELVRAQGKRAIICSSTTIAVNNIAGRYMELDSEEQALSVRLHPHSFETHATLAHDPEIEIPKGFASAAKQKRVDKMLWEDYIHFAKCMKVPRLDPDEDGWKSIKTDGKRCAKEIVGGADFVFSTCITAGSKWARQFRHECDFVFLDEAGSITEAEALILWKGDKPLVLGGDTKQLPPPCLSSSMKHVEGSAVNGFSDQVKYPILERLCDIGFPFYLIPEQMRLGTGQFDLANVLHYDNKIRYHVTNKLTALTVIFEAWTPEFSQSTIAKSPTGKSFPLLLAVANSHTFVEPKGISKGNSHFIHYRITSLLSFFTFCKIRGIILETSDFAIITPYQKEASMWKKALSHHQQLLGIQIATVNSMQGFEKEKQKRKTVFNS
ncbi:uncharacterized protein RAG0_15315 [Rhynchosporium agropyri]|uniref:DNA2/NAM7 helicase helicase domain-containing protein n=1 Tax=Rhynchosporium agropyri TaxID=914238 RepID=A0A1E1LKJ3_9HELO|nr:uncharacterized protein RAG0_15315 [Rhynchosporium agropyri]